MEHAKLAEINYLIEEGEFYTLKDVLKELEPAELVELINEQEEKEQLIIFRLLPTKLAARTFEYLDFETQEYFINALNNDKVAAILNEMSPDDRTALLEYLPNTVVKELIAILSETERKVTLELLGYPESSVGRLVTPDYVAIKEDMTVEEVIDHIREFGHDSETISVLYVVDEKGILIDDIRLREVILAPKGTLVRDLIDHKFVALRAMQDQEEAVEIFRKNDRNALPVLDEEGLLFGIVTVDDMLSVVKEEDTEDIQKLGGTEALEEPYLTIPLLDMVKKRAGWLVILLLGEMLTASAMSFFEDEIAKAVVLTLFIPLIISSGGNTGSQATTLIIRAMAIGEVYLSDWWRVMRRELLLGLMLGGILGLIGFLRILVWAKFMNSYGPHWLGIAYTVGFSLVGVVLWGSLSGSMLPILLKKLKLDPATSSAPFVATLVDVTGLVIYFSFAFFFLRGTLL
ncbi:magnesium transporter [Adhaeribacter terreus]|uniref:Magnesium transporter MgtE n=1 Tax=Adhaeribacter terreus TaxID=529703 RepID=A0ABW0EB54_9BACT